MFAIHPLAASPALQGSRSLILCLVRSCPHTHRSSLERTRKSWRLALLSELQPAIAAALDSLGGKMTKGVEDLYCLYASRQINTAVDAFILLRRDHRIDGARLLVRPALEAMLRL